MAREFWNFYPIYLTGIFIILILIYMTYIYKKKNDQSELAIPFLLSLLLLLIASYCGFYPIQDRLVQTYAIVGIVLVGYECDTIGKFIKTIRNTRKKTAFKFAFYGLLIICLFITAAGGVRNISQRHVYKAGSEVEKSMQYIKNNVTKNDVIYIYRNAIPIYTYETGYKISYSDLKSLTKKKATPKELLPALPIQIDNTIYGQTLVNSYYKVPYSYAYGKNKKAVMEDAKLIMKNKSVYLFISHRKAGVDDLIDVLETEGTVEEVVNHYDTHLYHFIKNK